MSNENNLKSKFLYKITLYVLKILPMIMVFSYLIMLTLYELKINLIIIPHILGTVLAPIIFLYITSYVFRFCQFHRIFIHYYAFIQILNVTDHYYYKQWLNPNIVTIIHNTGTIVFIITAIILYIIKYKKDKCITQLDKKII